MTKTTDIQPFSRRSLNPAARVMDWLIFDFLCIEPEWMLASANSIRWWSGCHTQLIELIPESGERHTNSPGSLRIVTEVCQLPEDISHVLLALNAHPMRSTSMSAPIVQDRKLLLSSYAYCKADQKGEVLKKHLGAASILQLHEAMALREILEEAGCSYEPAAHPENGVCVSLHPLVVKLKYDIIKSEMYLSPKNAKDSDETYDDWIKYEIPYAGAKDSILFTMMNRNYSPYLHGAKYNQRFPLIMPGVSGLELVQELNLALAYHPLMEYALGRFYLSKSILFHHSLLLYSSEEEIGALLHLSWGAAEKRVRILEKLY